MNYFRFSTKLISFCIAPLRLKCQPTNEDKTLEGQQVEKNGFYKLIKNKRGKPTSSNMLSNESNN